METIQNLDFVVVPRVLMFDGELRRVDCLVYGVVYALSQLGGSCTASNETIGNAVGISKSAAASSLKRLTDRHYVQSHNDPKTNWRRGIVPLVSFEKKPPTPTSNEVPPKPVEVPPKRNSRGVIRQEDNNKNISTVTTNVVEPRAHGNEEINSIVESFEEVFGIPQPAKERRAAQWLRSKGDTGTLTALFKATAEAQANDKYCPRTPTLTKFYYKLPDLQDYFKKKQQQSSSAGMIDISF